MSRCLFGRSAASWLAGSVRGYCLSYTNTLGMLTAVAVRVVGVASETFRIAVCAVVAVSGSCSSLIVQWDMPWRSCSSLSVQWETPNLADADSHADSYAASYAGSYTQLLIRRFLYMCTFRVQIQWQLTFVCVFGCVMCLVPFSCGWNFACSHTITQTTLLR